MAVCEVVGNAKIVDAAQRIGGLWRVYLTDRLARAQLLYTGINLRGVQITFNDKNPFLHPGQEHVETTRLFLRNIALSFENAEITNSLKDMGVQTLGKLTNFKTGDRFVDIVLLDEPLPKRKSMGILLQFYTIKSKRKSKHKYSV